MINDISRPLILLGSNANIYKLYELCQSVGYTIAGIIDDDYLGQGSFKDIPIIYAEKELYERTEYFCNNYQFFCATNWIPGSEFKRNTDKRTKLLELLDSLELPVATIVSPLAQVSNYARLGKGIFVDAFATIEPMTTVADYCSFYPYSYLGHDSVVGKNTVIQRYSFITSDVTVEDHVYLGIYSQVSRSYTTIRSNTFLHPSITILRDTAVNEEISLAGRDLRKVYYKVEVL